MLEPPSPQLAQRLQAWRLCNARGLRRSRRRVRRLACDLPAFDSVWIDALVQARLLSSFQARVLESDRPDDLVLGPYVLIDRLGDGPGSETLVGRPIDGRQKFVLKRIRTLPEDTQSIAVRLSELAAVGRTHAGRACVLPHASTTVGTDVVVVSRFIPGTHLADLLIRRGRFPIRLVTEIGRQILEGLVGLERLGISHGDLRLNNVRITSAGQLTLVDSGVAPIVNPQLIPHGSHPPETYDGVAPELIGTGEPPDMSSDLYALGCLLWQLLAGRPPFPTGDPLAKLAAHQTRVIPDIREWVPDTPDVLARNIAHLVEREPHRRPASAAAAAEVWGWSRRSARRELAEFQSRVTDHQAGRETSRASAGRALPAVLLLLFAVSGLAFSFVDDTKHFPLLRFGRPVREAVEQQLARWFAVPAESETQNPPKSNGTHPALAALPAPNAEGVMQLAAGESYEVSDVSMVGPLILRGDGEQPATIVVRDAPLRLWAEQLIVENVCFRRARNTGGNTTAKALLLVQSQEFVLSRCTFDATDRASGDAPPAAVSPPNSTAAPHQNAQHYAIGWQPVDSQDRAGTSILFSDVRFEGEQPALFVQGEPGVVQFRRCRAAGGPLVTLAAPPQPGRHVQFMLEDVELIKPGGVLRVWGHASPQTPIGSLDVNLERVQVVGSATASVVQWQGTAIPPQWNESVRISISESSASRTLQTAVLISPETGQRQSLTPGALWTGAFQKAELPARETQKNANSGE